MKRMFILLVLMLILPALGHAAGPAVQVSISKTEEALRPEPILKAIPLLNGTEYPEATLVEQNCLPHLRDAVIQRDLEFLKQLLACGLDINEHAPDGETALTAAIRLGADDVAAFLLQSGANTNEPGVEHQPPLALACLRHHADLIRLLLQAGANPNTPFAFPLTKPLLATCPDALLRSDLSRQRQVTPLMAAAAEGDVDVTTMLLEAGASTEAHTLPSYTYPINFAADRKHLPVMRLLIGRKPDSDPRVLITVDLNRQRCRMEIDGREVAHTIISTGRRGYETPPGHYMITNKYKQWMSTIYKVPMPYFLRLNCGSIGLHSGYVTGEPASHGCIRLPESAAMKFFSLASVGDEVVIER